MIKVTVLMTLRNQYLINMRSKRRHLSTYVSSTPVNFLNIAEIIGILSGMFNTSKKNFLLRDMRT